MNRDNKDFDIGLIAWGTKLGWKVFFNSENTSPQQPEIRRTLEDVRSIIQINYANLIFYSLEFTGKYKVYTLYKTIHDWDNRSNGYLALSLFVPYDLRFADGAKSVLKKMLRIYDERYIDESLRIKKNKEDAALFLDVMHNSHTIPYPVMGEKRPNHENCTSYAYIEYEREEEIDGFFKNPNLPEFAPYKEIFFLPGKNDQLSATKSVTLISVDSRSLAFPIKFSLLDNNGNLITPPFSFLFDQKPYPDQNPVTLKIEETPTISYEIEINKKAFKPITKTIAGSDILKRVNQNVFEIILEQEEYSLSIMLIDQRGVSIPGVQIRTVFSNGTKGAHTTDPSGIIKLNKLKDGDEVTIHVEKNGYEPLSKSFAISEKTTGIYPLELKGRKNQSSPYTTKKEKPSSTEEDSSGTEIEIAPIESIASDQQKDKYQNGRNFEPEKPKERGDPKRNQDQEGRQPKRLSVKKLMLAGFFVSGLIILVFLLFKIPGWQAAKKTETKRQELIIQINKQYDELRKNELAKLYNVIRTIDSAFENQEDFVAQLVKTTMANKMDTIKAIREDLEKTKVSVTNDSIKMVEQINHLTSSTKEESSSITQTVENKIHEWKNELNKHIKSVSATRNEIDSLAFQIEDIRTKVKEATEKILTDGTQRSYFADALKLLEGNKAYFTEEEINAYSATLDLLKEVKRLEHNYRNGIPNQWQPHQALTSIANNWQMMKLLTPQQREWVKQKIK
ncbi:MAG: hypothetical protein ACKV1O_05690 [Saprospiraceae bacterium]